MIRALIPALALLWAAPAVAQTGDEARAALTTISNYIDKLESQVPAAPIDYTAPIFTVDPAQAGPDDRLVSVRIRASKPAPYTITMNVGMSNGTAYAPVFFDSSKTYSVTFPMGETEQIVTLPLSRELGVGRTIKVRVGGGSNNLNNNVIPATEGLITGAATNAAEVTRLAPIYTPVPAKMTQGRKLVYSSDFKGPISYKPEPGAWRTVLTGGRGPINGGTGISVDETTNPGLGSHPILVDENGVERRVLRLFECDVVVNGTSFKRCLNTLTSNKLFAFRRGDFVELTAKFEVGNGFQFAFWTMNEKGSWPPEDDGPETCLEMEADKCRISFNRHFVRDGKHVMYGYTSNVKPDGKLHKYGMDWRLDGVMIFLLDGKELFREASPVNEDMHVIIGGETQMGGRGNFVGEAKAWLHQIEFWR